MRIGYVLTNFPPLSETFIRREIQALCRAGHRVFVYTNKKHRDPLVPQLSERMLNVREIPFLRNTAKLVRAAREDGIEHLHGSLMPAAHLAAHAAAVSLQTMFSIRAYSGYGVFTARNPKLYQGISADRLCAAIIAEDPFMRDWLAARLGAVAEKVAIIANSLDLELYRLPRPRMPREKVVILAIARFVEKKGLIYLVRAFNRLCAARSNVELRLVGAGSEATRLRQAAARNPKIKFLGLMAESETRKLYAEADIFCLPCVRGSDGDADGVPTTVLEAMAFELPVVTSNLFSMPHYVRDSHEGFLVAPGDVDGLVVALEKLCADASLREKLGKAGRVKVSELCDIKQNVERLQSIMLNSRAELCREKLATFYEGSAHCTEEREKFYTECRIRAANHFKASGRLLEIGCGHGRLRPHLGPGVDYFGCDIRMSQEARRAFPFVAARAEALPYRDETFDSAVLYAVLHCVFDIDAVLAEAARVLKPGGRLYLQECFNDPNPIHINHLSDTGLRNRVSEHFKVVSSRPANSYLMLMIAEKSARKKGQI